MKLVFCIAALFALFSVVPAGSRPSSEESEKAGSQGSHFTADNRSIWPEGYRQWIWLSSGYGMSYSPQGMAMEPQFDNVFADPAAYRIFEQTGQWPDGTRLVLEEREGMSHGSINKDGHFQGALRGLEVEVKDSVRFHGGWAFFAFGLSTKPVGALPPSAACYSCHAQNGAVDNTFVQFYPTLLEIARQKGTLRKQ